MRMDVDKGGGVSKNVQEKNLAFLPLHPLE